MKISVVIPLYNKDPYIKRALLSVLAQTFQDFEVIVVDDGSTDDGMKILKNISDFRTKLIQQKNAGVSAARNRGIKEAKADLIAFLDADDEWTSDHLKTIVNLWKRFPQAGAYGTTYEKIYSQGKVERPKLENIPPPPWEGLIPNYFKSAFPPMPFCSSTVAIPKHVFSLVGYFPVGVQRGEDQSMWCRIALKYKIAFSHYLGAFYHHDSERRIYNVHSPSLEIVIQTCVNEINKREISKNLLADVKEYIAELQMRTAYYYLLIDKPKKFREILINTHPKTLSSNCFRKYWWLFWSIVPLRFFHFSFFFANIYNCFPEAFKKKYRACKKKFRVYASRCCS